MAKALSQDLRSRVIAAVEGGMSRQAAAARFRLALPRREHPRFRVGPGVPYAPRGRRAQPVGIVSTGAIWSRLLSATDLRSSRMLNVALDSKSVESTQYQRSAIRTAA
jgi:hypothetical protein